MKTKSLPIIPIGLALSLVGPTLLIQNVRSEVEAPTLIQQVQSEVIVSDDQTTDPVQSQPDQQIPPEWKVIRALIRTIYYAEGTLNKPNPYAVGFGYRDIGIEKHPDEDGGFCHEIGGEWSGQCSSAAGAGQWILNTWNGMQERYPILSEISDPFCPVDHCEFGPIPQDLAMYFKINDRKALQPILDSIYFGEDGATLIPKEVFVNELEKKLSREWASIPCLTGLDYTGLDDNPSNDRPCTGTSFYGQGGKDIETLWSVFNEELAKENQGEWNRQYQQLVEMGVVE